MIDWLLVSNGGTRPQASTPSRVAKLYLHSNIKVTKGRVEGSRLMKSRLRTVRLSLLPLLMGKTNSQTRRHPIMAEKSHCLWIWNIRERVGLLIYINN